MSADNGQLPAPADFGWRWEDVETIVATNHHAAQEKAIITRIPGLHPAVARAWLTVGRDRIKAREHEARDEAKRSA